MAGQDNADLVAALVSPDEEAEIAVEAESDPSDRIAGIVVGRLVALLDATSALVILPRPGPTTPLRARRLASLRNADLGREVALMFEGGNAERPVIIGLIESPPETAGRGVPEPGEGVEIDRPLELDADTIFLNGRTQIVLRCGKASITLTRAGKVLVRGTYLLNRSSGVNRIKGGSVQIN